MKKIIFIEKFSLLRGILLYRYIREADEIILFSSTFPVEFGSNRKRVRRFVGAIGAQTTVTQFSREDVNTLNWKVNKRALKINDHLEEVYTKSSSFRAISKIFKTNQLATMFKHRMLFFVLKRLLFLTQAVKLFGENCNIVIIPEYNDYLGLEQKVFPRDTINISNHVPHAIFILNRFYHIVNILVTFFKYLAYPFWLISQYGIGRSKSKITAPYGMQVFRGISRNKLVSGTKSSIDSDFIYDDDLIRPEQVVQYFWGSVSRQINKEETKSVIKKIGGKFIDEDDMKIHPDIFFKTAIKGCLNGIMACIREVFKFNEAEILRQGASLLNIITREKVLCHYVNTKVFLSFDDQTVESTTRTVLLNKKGIRHFGHQHSSQGGTYLLPHLAYVNFDKYLVCGRKYIDLFTPYWNKKTFTISGNWRLDFDFRSKEDANIKKKFKNIYGKNYNILVTPPGNGVKNVRERIINFYQGLNDLLSIDPSIHIILRPRTLKASEKYLPIIDKEIRNGRISIEMVNFDTHDLVVNADMIITSNTSSVFIGAVCARKDVIAYNFDYLTNLIWAKYDPEIVVEKPESMKHKVQLIFNKRWDKRKTYSKICYDFNAYYDGYCIDRIRKHMKNSIS